MDIRCNGCKKKPHELDEYVELAKDEGHETAEAAVREDDGTFNHENGHFWCTECYIKAGMPLGAAA